MITRKANAEWTGDLKTGTGNVAFGSGAYSGPYSFKSRFENGTGTNPEELVAAAHAGCFSMALSASLSGAGFPPSSIRTTAAVKLDEVSGGFAITSITLTTEASVSGIDNQTFQDIAAAAKKNCPISKALAGTEILLNAKHLS